MARSLLLRQLPGRELLVLEGCILPGEDKKRMASTLSPSEEAQLAQTIEMFEVITQSQPHDYQSLEILKDGFLQLPRGPGLGITVNEAALSEYREAGQ